MIRLGMPIDRASAIAIRSLLLTRWPLPPPLPLPVEEEVGVGVWIGIWVAGGAAVEKVDEVDIEANEADAGVNEFDTEGDGGIEDVASQDDGISQR